MARGKRTQKNKPTLLIILDGFGLANPKNPGNAINPSTAPRIFSYMDMYPSSSLSAHGKDVGLFNGQAGNSEAGHLNIGAGRLVKQDLVYITDAIKNGTFFKNEAFNQAIRHTEKYNSSLHIMGLLTDGHSAHAHPEHLYALLKLMRKRKVKNVYVHLFTDGRDSTPHSAVQYLSVLRKQMKNGEKIASICGRFYAMDRNKTWDRTEKAYMALTQGKGFTATSAEEAILAGYNRGENDEYIQPTIIEEDGKPVATIEENDAVILFNARSDRARQMAKVFVQPDFNKKNPGSFKRKKKYKNISFVGMTDFGPDLAGILTAFPSPDISMCLAAAIGEEYTQLYISETEKYAHVTFFLNGGYPEPINGEDRELLPSTGHYNYADHPEMSTREVTKEVLDYLKKGTYDFFCINFPNADMCGHTGDLIAAKKAVRTVDTNVHKLVTAFLKKNGRVMITADHGNAEEMIDQKSGEALTEHTRNKVPCIVIDKDVVGRKLKKGKLADVAPTLLQLMGIKKPKDMTGKNLLV